MDKRKQPLGIELVKRRVVTAEDIENALAYQEKHHNRKIGDILYILKATDPNILIEEISDILGRKGVYLQQNDITIEPTNYIPIDLMKKNLAIPYGIESGKIKVAFADITNKDENIKSIKMLMLNKGLVVDPYIAFQTNVEEMLEKYEENSKKKMEYLDTSDKVTELLDSIIKLSI